MKGKDKYCFCFLGLFFLICMVGFDDIGTVQEDYNICFRAQIISPIYISSLCVMISSRMSLINENIFVIRMNTKGELIIFFGWELLRLLLKFTLITNVMAIISLIPCYGMKVVDVNNIIFFAVSFVKQYWGWYLVGCALLFVFFMTQNRVISSVIVIVVFEILCMAYSQTISYKEYLYDFPKTILVNLEMKDRIGDMNHILHNLVIGTMIIAVCNYINNHRSIYGTGE